MERRGGKDRRADLKEGEKWKMSRGGRAERRER